MRGFEDQGARIRGFFKEGTTAIPSFCVSGDERPYFFLAVFFAAFLAFFAIRILPPLHAGF
jgi:hypothetical protein